MRMELYKMIDILEAVHIIETVQDGLEVEDPDILYAMLEQVLDILVEDE